MRPDGGDLGGGCNLSESMVIYGKQKARHTAAKGGSLHGENHFADR